MILILPILISLMSTATVEAFSNNSNNNINNSNSNINNNLNSQLTRQRSPSLPQQVRRSSSSSALSAHGFHTNHHDSLVYTSSLVRSSSVPTNINRNRNRNRRKRSSSSHRSGPLFLAPMDLVAFSSAISAKYQAKKGAAGLIQKVAGKAVVVTTSASTATTSAALITTATVAATATATATVTAAATATATDTTVVATAAAAATTTISDSAHQMVVATATAIASPDKQAEVLSDSSFALCEYPTFLPDMKTSKLRIKVAQVLGRILIIGISLLPGHTFHPEELAIQLFLLGGSIQPLIRSMKLLRKIQAVQCNKDGCVIDFAELEDDDELGDVESTSAVIDGAGHGRLEYTFGGDTGTGGGSDDDNNGGVSVQCNSDGCTIDFDDLNDDDDSLGDVVTDDDMSVILECTLTGDDDGGLECTAVTDSENHKKDHDHNNLVASSFDDVNVDSSRAATSRVVVESNVL